MDLPRQQPGIEYVGKKSNLDLTQSTNVGDVLITFKHRPPSPAPYAFHEVEGEKTIKKTDLRAPYAQPVLDASKLSATKKMTPVNERLASVRERRLQQQQIHDQTRNARLAKEEALRSKWEHAQEQKHKKVEEQKEREAQRRKEVEERKSRQDFEDKKRAEAIVARTEQHANAVLRQKRAGSIDRTKRWSWGAGGSNKDFAIDEKFSKSPLVVNTTHMKFASGLRSYDSIPSPSGRNLASPVILPRNRRARSSDTCPQSATSDAEVSCENLETKPITRGRSADVRKSPNSKGSANNSAQQLTEPAVISSRLLAPTKASIARSINRDLDELSAASSNANVSFRSRSSDRKQRPSTGKSHINKTFTNRGVSPSISSRPKQRPHSPTIGSTTSSNEKREEPSKSKSPVVKESLTFSKRGPSPGRSKSFATPKKDLSNANKHTPPQIKQSITPTNAVPRTMFPLSSTSTGILSKKVSKKMQELDTSLEKSESDRKHDEKVSRQEKNKEAQYDDVVDHTYLVISSPKENNAAFHQTQDIVAETFCKLLVAEEFRQSEQESESVDTIIETANNSTKSIEAEPNNVNDPELLKQCVIDEILNATPIEGKKISAPSAHAVNKALTETVSESDKLAETASGLSDDIIETAQNELQKEITVQTMKEIPLSNQDIKASETLSSEEQAYKNAIAAKRKEMKDKREREEKEKQERLRTEAAQQARREEDARKMAEDARLEHERTLEDERLKKEEEETKKKEAEEMAKKHEEFLKEQREKAVLRAREEAEKIRRDRELVSQKKEEERLARKKRLEMIMRRTRGNDSPTNNTSNLGSQSPANMTPVRGNSPDLLTPDRANSPVESVGLEDIAINSTSSSLESKSTIIQLQPGASKEMIELENSTPPMHFIRNDHQPSTMAVHKPFSSNENHSSSSIFSPFDGLAAHNFPTTLDKSDTKKNDYILESGSEKLCDNTSVLTAAILDENVPTDNLLDL